MDLILFDSPLGWMGASAGESGAIERVYLPGAPVPRIMCRETPLLAEARRQLLAPEGTGQALLCTSDRPEDFGQMARRFLQEEPTAPVRLVDIEGY